MRNMRVFWTLCNAVVAFAVSAMTQDELDKIVFEELTLLEHYEDVASGEQSLKEKQGVTGEMLARSYAKVANRYLSASDQSMESQACNAAIWGLSRNGTDEQLTNLVNIACASTNFCAQSAILAFHDRKPGSKEFFKAADVLMSKNISPVFESLLWNRAEKDIERFSPEVKLRAVAFAEKHLLKNAESFFYADRILRNHSPHYEFSLKRKMAVKEMLDGGRGVESNDFLRTHFEKIKKQLEVR